MGAYCLLLPSLTDDHRHGHLILFDNSDQLEVRHVIALAHYDVDLYAGGERIPEGELFIKRNSVRLSQKSAPTADATPVRPFYLFSENCSAKEDMYFAILHNQERYATSQKTPPSPQSFETEDMISLIRQLHLSESSSHSRWINAMLGRVFLGIYKTSFLENLIRSKLTKKIARVSKPAFITSLRLGDIDMGHSAPTFANTRLKECTVDGDVMIETDVKYNGQFRLVIGAVARIELGSRLKPREVEMLLAGTVRLLDGHLLFRIKPPPSNRIWFSFESMPKLEMTIEPIVSSRQITYSIILRAIESRIREVFAETLVQPFWDDVPFFNTEDSDLRGGIWKQEKAAAQRPTVDRRSSAPADGHDDATVTSPELVDPEEPSVSAPSLLDEELSPQRANSMPVSSDDSRAALHPTSTSTSIEKPRALRANSFASAADPVISAGPVKLTTPQSQIRRRQRDATAALNSLSTQASETASGEMSETNSRSESPSSKARSNSLEEGTSPTYKTHRRASSIPTSGISLGSKVFDSSKAPPLPTLEKASATHASALTAALRANDQSDSSASSISDIKTAPTVKQAASAERAEQRKAAINQTLQSIGTATNVARNWGMGVVQRQMDARKQAASPGPKSPGLRANASEPMGRGQPLPPPGQPLPRPAKDTWSSMALGSLRRKPIGGASFPSQAGSTPGAVSTSSLSSDSEQSQKSESYRSREQSLKADPIEPSFRASVTDEANGGKRTSELSAEPYSDGEDEPVGVATNDAAGRKDSAPEAEIDSNLLQPQPAFIRRESSGRDNSD